MSNKYVYAAILCISLLAIIPAQAGIMYPSEYYVNGATIDAVMNDITITHPSYFNMYSASRGDYVVFLELRRQTILMEKQNELLAEQNRIGWINICYVPHTGMYPGTGNLTAMRTECNDDGYLTKS
jgi:hypothetical protein